MERINSPSAVPNMHGTGKAGFTEGSLAQQIPTTVLTDDWCNAVQEEIARTIELAGISLSAGSHEQLAAAVFGKRVLLYTGSINSETAFNPPGWSECDIAFLNCTGGDGKILGFAPNVLKPHKRIFSSGPIPISLVHNSSSAPAGSRIVSQNNLAVTLVFNLSADIALAAPNGVMNTIFGQAWYTSNYQSLIFPYPVLFNGTIMLGPNANIAYANANGTPTPRSSLKQLFQFISSKNSDASQAALAYSESGYFLTLAAGYAIFPIDLPSGSVLNNVRFAAQLPSGSLSASVWKDQVTAGDGTVTQFQLGSTVTITGTSMNVSDVGGFPPETIDGVGSDTGYFNRYYFKLNFSAAAQTIRFLRAWYNDIGPR